MKKRIISFLLVLCMVAAMLPLTALAAAGTLDDSWVSNTVKVYKDGTTLHVYGTGSMADYASSKDTDWYAVSGNIQRIVIEAGVAKLGKNAFASCGSVSTIVLKRDLSSPTLGMDATSLPTGANVELEISGNVYMPDYDSNQPWANLKTRLSKVTLHEGVRSIGAQAFSGCTKLKSVVIPGSAEYIGKEAFANCLSLSSVYLIHDFSHNAASGKPFTIGADAFPAGNAGFSITLEISGNGAIPDYASADQQPWADYRPYLNKLIVGGDVPAIGNNAFHSCNKLGSISIYFNENAQTATKHFGSDCFKYPGNKTLNIVGVSAQYAFEKWSGATFANAASENTVVFYNALGMDVTAKWSAVNRAIELKPDTEKFFGDLELGYANVEPHQLTVKNTGNIPSGTLQIELSGGYPNAFQLSTQTLANLNPGATAVFAVVPVAGMPIGSYYTDVIVSDSVATIAIIRVSYLVGDPLSRASRFVMRMYTRVLNRPESAVTEEEKNGWAVPLMQKTITASQVAAEFLGSAEYRSVAHTNADFVTDLYEGLLDRTPSGAEVANWVNGMVAGMNRNAILAAFLGSQEFKNVCERDTILPGNVDVSKVNLNDSVPATAAALAFVTRLYDNCFGGQDPVGMNNWAVELTNGRLSAAQVAAGIFDSPQYRNSMKSDKDFVIDLYETILGRDPDVGGLNHWVASLANGMTRPQVFNGFCTSPEFAGYCVTGGFAAGSIDPSKFNMGTGTGTGGGTGIIKMSDADADAAVRKLYTDILGREVDEGGLAANKSVLVGGSATHATVAAGIAGSEEFRNRDLSDDAFLDAIGNALVGNTFTDAQRASMLVALQTGTTRAAVFANVCNSQEYKNYCQAKGYAWGSIDPAKYNMNTPHAVIYVSESVANELITRCYAEAWAVAATETDIKPYRDQMMNGSITGADLAASFFASDVCKARGLSAEDFVKAIYRVLLYREADEGGLANWANAINNGTARSQVFSDIVNSGEYTDCCNARGFAPARINPAAYNMG